MTRELPVEDLPTMADLGDAERDEFAAAYLDLLAKLNWALNTSPHDTAFVTWSGRGYDVSGHFKGWGRATVWKESPYPGYVSDDDGQVARTALDRDGLARAVHDTQCPDGSHCLAEPSSWGKYYRQADAIRAWVLGQTEGTGR